MLQIDQHEEHLLGAMILSSDVAVEASTIVSGGDFTSPDNQKAYAAIVDATSAKIPVVAELQRLIRSRETLLTVRWLNELVTESTASQWRYHAGKVLESSHRRALVRVADIARQAMDDTSKPQDIESEIREELDSISSAHGKSGITMTAACDAFVERLMTPNAKPPVYSGLSTLDQCTGGFRPGQLIILGGRPGEGKSALGLQIAIHNADCGHPVCYVSFEMKTDELIERVVCGKAGIDSRAVNSAGLQKITRDRLILEAEKIKHLPITFWDITGVKLQRLIGMISVAVRRDKACLVVIDYLGLIEKLSSKVSTIDHVTECTRRIKNLAGELDVPILLLCQLNRSADGQRPTLGSLRDSGSIEQDANMVLFTHTEMVDNRLKNMILIAKNRSGEVGAAEVIFDKVKVCFTDPGTRWEP